MTNKDLQMALEAYPDDYQVDISIGEESDCIDSIFVDSDNGVIELTNFKDDDETLVTRVHFHDQFDVPIYEGDRVLYIAFKEEENQISTHITMAKGTVKNLLIEDNTAHLDIENYETREITQLALQLNENGTEPHGKIINFHW